MQRVGPRTSKPPAGGGKPSNTYSHSAIPQDGIIFEMPIPPPHVHSKAVHATKLSDSLLASPIVSVGILERFQIVMRFDCVQGELTRCPIYPPKPCPTYAPNIIAVFRRGLKPEANWENTLTKDHADTCFAPYCRPQTCWLMGSVKIKSAEPSCGTISPSEFQIPTCFSIEQRVGLGHCRLFRTYLHVGRFCRSSCKQTIPSGSSEQPRNAKCQQPKSHTGCWYWLLCVNGLCYRMINIHDRST